MRSSDIYPSTKASPGHKIPSLSKTFYLVHQSVNGEQLSSYYTIKLSVRSNLQNLIQTSSKQLKFGVMSLWNARTKLKVMSIRDINDFDVIVATDVSPPFFKT